MLVELGLVEQRLAAVLEVLGEGATVTDVARRYGVGRQTVHRWLRTYAVQGLGGLADRSSRPLSCPHQMVPEVEARIVEMRRAHPGWGPRTIVYWLERDGVVPVPGRTSVERCLVRHGLVTPQARKRKRSDYKRWERSRAMELWQMDIVGGVRLADGGEAKIVSGIDDHSRFVISARVVARATARPVCGALEAAMVAHGVPEAILTDNGKVFTARFGSGPGPVLFDRICTNNSVKHLLTAPRSPTTTGKIERWHKTLRREFLNGKVFESIDGAQTQLDRWVWHYNHERPHQSVGGRPPIERFRLAAPGPGPVEVAEPDASTVGDRVTTRRVALSGTISFAAAQYKAGAWLAGQAVEVRCEGGLVQLLHRGVLVATHARRHAPDKQAAALERGRQLPPAPKAVTAASVTRKVDSGVHRRPAARHRRHRRPPGARGSAVGTREDAQRLRHDGRDPAALPRPGRPTARRCGPRAGPPERPRTAGRRAPALTTRAGSAAATRRR